MNIKYDDDLNDLTDIDFPPLRLSYPEKPICGRCYDEVDELFPANCNEKPEDLVGQPIGMYHCPDCGAMVLAGIPHPHLCKRCIDREHPSFDTVGEPMKHEGFHVARLQPERDNPREVAFAEAWKDENKNCCTANMVIPHCTERDAQVAATIIQWLGSNVGMSFLYKVINSNKQIQEYLSNRS